MELDEIVVYHEGRRVPLESEEKAQLLKEASLHHETSRGTVKPQINGTLSGNLRLTLLGLGFFESF